MNKTNFKAEIDSYMSYLKNIDNPFTGLFIIVKNDDMKYPELIFNNGDNLKNGKIDYYLNAYDDNMCLKTNNKIKIVGLVPTTLDDVRVCLNVLGIYKAIYDFPQNFKDFDSKRFESLLNPDTMKHLTTMLEIKERRYKSEKRYDGLLLSALEDAMFIRMLDDND